MRIVFMGTPEFAVPSLKILIEEKEDIICVITKPDRRKGRGMEQNAPPVKQLAMANNLRILQPESAKDPDFIKDLKALKPDIIVVVAYGQILSKEFLTIPKLGCINVHASLLPKFRGSAPIQWAIMEGESKTGVTIQNVLEKLDSGDIIVQKATEITQKDNFRSLHTKLADLGAEALKEAVNLIKNKNVRLIPQDERSATYIRKITKEDGLINWNESALKIHNKIRALNPWPGTYTFISGLMIKVISAEFVPGKKDGKPGEIITADKEKIGILCADGVIYIKEVKPEAKKVMTAGEFVSGYRLKPGMR